MVGSAIENMEVVRRYTRALLDLAKENDAEESIECDLAEFKAMMASSPDLRYALVNPALGRVPISELLIALSEQAGFHPITRNFFAVTANMGRSYLIQQIAILFADRRAEAQGFRKVQVTLASSPSPETKKSVMQMLEDLLGSRLHVMWDHDRRILGGLRIQLGTWMIDASLGSWFEQISVAMKTGE